MQRGQGHLVISPAHESAHIAGRFLSARRSATGLADYPGPLPRTLDEGLDAAEAALLGDVAEIASGRPCAAERNGERELAIWKRGVTL